MELFGLDDDERVITETAAAFAAKRLAPHALEWDETEHFPVEALREAAELGMAAIYCREDAGGSGLRRLDAVRIFEQLAYAEDRTIVLGYAAAGIEGIREGTSNPVLPLPAQATDYPDVIAAALKQLKLVGVDGPYVAVLGASVYTSLQEANDKGYPVLNHIQRLVGSDNIIWAPAIEGAYLLSTRGGDFELNLGRDLSIGYLSHTETTVRLYLEETLTFRLLTSEAAVAIAPKA